MVRRYAKESEIPKGGSEWRKGGAGAASEGHSAGLGSESPRAPQLIGDDSGRVVRLR